MQEGHSQPRKGLHCSAGGAQGMGNHWRDCTREEHNQICIFTRILSDQSVLENRPQKGRPVTPAEWHTQSLESTGGGFSFRLTFWLPHCQRRPRCWMVLTKPPISQAYDKFPYTHKFRYGQTIQKRLLPLSCHSSPPWHPGTVSSNKAFSGTLYPVVDQEKQTRWYSPAKEALAACRTGRVSWPLNRLPLVAHNPLRLQKDWQMGSRVWKGCVVEKTGKSGFNTPSVTGSLYDFGYNIELLWASVPSSIKMDSKNCSPELWQKLKDKI